ncbi:PaaI family thioesterase [Aspergillus lucknowensis]|uniref:HotDog domain-containing protein n=1 Tax=Aspergillus lucknowensis TaxID=176173 RepID=A0ABR4M4K1_9EURO
MYLGSLNPRFLLDNLFAISSQTFQVVLQACDGANMIGSRQVIQSRLRYAATQFGLIRRSISQGSRNASTSAQHASSRSSLWLRRLLYAGTFGGLGFLVDSRITKALTSPPPVPGSEHDMRRMDRVRTIFEERLPIVKQLREDPDYTESDVYGNYSWRDKEQRLTSGPLSGSRGLAYQKVFWNSGANKAVNVVFLGKGIEGWPVLVHGGALATILDEHLARVAIQNLPERTAVTANLDINYRKMVASENFYAVHATLDQERSTDRKAYVNGEIRDMRGNVLVESSGLFVVPRSYKLRRIGDTY